MRRALPILVIAAVVVVALEGISWLGLFAIDGEAPSRAGLERQREARRARVMGGDGPAEVRRRAAEQVARALHPYLGWVKDADVADPAIHLPVHDGAREYGFPHNPASLFQPADPRRLVVVVLGGSFAAALVRDAGDALTRALAAQPRFAGREPLVLSLALPGFKQPQQLMALAWFLALGAHFDLVINLDGYNELVASVTNVEMRGVHPAYPKRWFERVGELEGELRRATGLAVHLQELSAERAEAFSTPPLRWSFFAGLIWRLLDRLLESRMAVAQERLAVAGGSGSHQTRGPRVGVGSGEALLDEIAAFWGRSSRQMAALARGSGGEYHHFLQPNQYVEGSKQWTAAERDRTRRPGQRRAELVRQGYPRLQRVGAELRGDGIHFHDLTQVFRDVAESVYVDTCCHVNRFGSALVAEALARSVGDHPPPLDSPARSVWNAGSDRTGGTR